MAFSTQDLVDTKKRIIDISRGGPNSESEYTSGTFWKLIEVASANNWLFRDLDILKASIELTYPGIQVDYYPVDLECRESDSDANVFVDGQMLFRIIEDNQVVIEAAQVLM